MPALWVADQQEGGAAAAGADRFVAPSPPADHGWATFAPFSAVLSGVPELRELLAMAQLHRRKGRIRIAVQVQDPISRILGSDGLETDRGER